MKVKKNTKTVPNDNAVPIKLVNEILLFLQTVMPLSLAKRILSIVLILAGVPNETITTWTGSCDRSVRQWRKQIETGNTSDLLVIKGGSGRKSKLSEIEPLVVKELEQGNYQTQQQIADMVQEKFGVTVSLMAVSRFLKKTTSKS